MHENLKNIPFDSPERNYKDKNHKPELICALTPFIALKGFRRNQEIIKLMEIAGALSCGLETDRLRKIPAKEGLKEFIRSLFNMGKEQQIFIIQSIIKKVNLLKHYETALEWIERLYDEHPDDIGVLSPLFLNIITLKPNEAMFIDSGELHAYLEGAGLELMANSDNVIRGGLTSKHIDTAGLMNILVFEHREPRKILPEKIGNNEAVYPTDNEEFTLSVITLKGNSGEGSIYHGLGQRSAEIIICTDGKARIEDIDGDEIIELSKGMSLFIPASIQGYIISGAATLYKAATPLKINPEI